MVNRSTGYLLGLSGIICFILVGESLLLIPHRLQDVLNLSPGWLSWVVAFGYFTLGLLLSAGLFLNHSRNRQREAYIAASLAFAALAVYFGMQQRAIETAWFASQALAFLAATSFAPRNTGWHVLSLIVANIAAGFLLGVPAVGEANEPLKVLSDNNFILSIIFITSSVINLLTIANPEHVSLMRTRLLGIPWLLWGLGHLSPLDYPSLLVALTAAFLGLLDGMLPWEKLILREGYQLGRRFFIFFGLTLGVLLFLLAFFLLVTDANLASGISAEQLRDLAFGGYNLLLLMLMYIIASIHLSINGLISGLYGELPTMPRMQDTDPLLRKLVLAMLQPFTLSRDLLNNRLKRNQEYEDLLATLMRTEKKRMAQLNLLHQINLSFEMVLDPPVSAQLTVNAILQAIDANLCAILEYDANHQQLVTLASNGRMAAVVPPGYAQGIHTGIMGRAARLRRTQLVSDTRLDPEYIHLEGQYALTELVVPLIYAGHFKGVLVVDSDQPNAFDDSDIRTLEATALRLATSWERADHDSRLTNLIEAGVTLSTTLDVGRVIQEIASISRNALGARFVFVALADKGGGFTRTGSAGDAPTLAAMLGSDPQGNALIQTVLQEQNSLRLRDVRKRFVSLPTGDPELRPLLATPIRLRQSSIGAILAFGKTNGANFNESDEALANLISTQAAASIETSWLYQELRGMYNIATQQAELSFRIIQAEKMAEAAQAVAEVAYKLSRASMAGIVIYGAEGQVQAQLQIDSNGVATNNHQPALLIEQSLRSKQMMVDASSGSKVTVCMPLNTLRGNNGILWVEISEESWNTPNFSETLRTLSNQAAIALERSILLIETRRQAEKLEEAYNTLEQTYDQTLLALSSALDARDRETEGHSQRVATIAYKLGKYMHMTDAQAKTMERGAILHDIGKIGISDAILLKPGPLTELEWQIMRQHPDIGARIVEGIPFLQDALPVIRYHQERWDGSGYPLGLRGEQIPLMARLFAVVDAFDALTTERPYRTKISYNEAIDYLKEQSGALFDPEIVSAFADMISQGLLAEYVT